MNLLGYVEEWVVTLAGGREIQTSYLPAFRSDGSCVLQTNGKETYILPPGQVLAVKPYPTSINFSAALGHIRKLLEHKPLGEWVKDFKVRRSLSNADLQRIFGRNLNAIANWQKEDSGPKHFEAQVGIMLRILAWEETLLAHWWTDDDTRQVSEMIGAYSEGGTPGED